MIIFVQVFWCTCVFIVDMYTATNGIDGKRECICYILVHTAKNYQNCSYLNSHQESMEVPLAAHPCQTLVLLVCNFNLQKCVWWDLTVVFTFNHSND